MEANPLTNPHQDQAVEDHQEVVHLEVGGHQLKGADNQLVVDHQPGEADLQLEEVLVEQVVAHLEAGLAVVQKALATLEKLPHQWWLEK